MSATQVDVNAVDDLATGTSAGRTRQLIVTAAGFAGLLLLLYGPLARTGFVVDYIGWRERVETGGLSGAVHTYDFPAHLQLYAVLMWTFERLRLVSPLLVQILLCAFGGLAAASLARFVGSEATRVGLRDGRWLGALAGLLWVVSPGGTELFALKVCPHYLLSAAYWTLGLYHFGRYLDRGERRDLALVLGVQALGLVTLELAYGLPLALLAYGIYRWTEAADRRTAARRAVYVVGSAIVLVGMHLLATRVAYGTWIGHYGAEAVTALPPREVLAAPWRWLARGIVHLRYWSHDVRGSVTAALATNGWLVVAYGSAVGFAGLAAWQRWHGRTRRWHLLVLWLALAGIAAGPVATMYFFDLQWVEGDRLGSLPTLFAVAGVSCALGLLGRTTIAVGGVGLVALSSYLLAGPWGAWAMTGRVIDGIVASAVELRRADPEADTVLLVGYVGNVKGAYALSDLRPTHSGLGSYLEAFHGDTDWPYFIEVAQFNQQTLSDSVNQEWGNDRLYVSLGADGAWWWRKQLGLAGYTDPTHRLRVDKHEYHFEIHFDDVRRAPLPAWYQVGTRLRSTTVPPSTDMERYGDR